MIRAAKTALVILLGLQVVFLALNNIANFEIAVGMVSYVISQTEHTAYPTSLFPALGDDMGGNMLPTAILCLIITAELVAGAALLKGGIDMARALRAPIGTFEQAKAFALLGCLLSIGVWFGLFVVLAGTFYQMWQTPLGRGSFNDSYTMVMFAAVLFLVIRSRETEASA